VDNVVSSSGNGKSWSRLWSSVRRGRVLQRRRRAQRQVAITSYTRHYDPTGINLDYAYWTALRHTASVQGATQRITTAVAEPAGSVPRRAPDGTEIQGVFIGDYSAVAIGSDQRIHPCWTDFRGRPGVNTPNQDAYTQSIQIKG
jgi:hypothetical protein